jgi:glycosyltransferase involved in cell wall biosynthesis
MTKDYVDEICIVDTGSIDGTLGYLKDMKAKKILKYKEFPWCDDFSAARNASLEMATGDWILILDADEHIRDVFYQQIREAMKSTDFDAFKMHIVHFHQDPRWVQNAQQLQGNAIRLFRNKPEHKYQGVVHNKLEIKKAAALQIPVYNFEWYEKDKIDWKCEQNKRLMDKKVKKEGWNHLNYVHYSDIYRKLWTWKGDIEAGKKAVHYLNKAIKLNFTPNLVQVRNKILEGTKNVERQRQSA